MDKGTFHHGQTRSQEPGASASGYSCRSAARGAGSHPGTATFHLGAEPVKSLKLGVLICQNGTWVPGSHHMGMYLVDCTLSQTWQMHMWGATAA